VTTTPPGDLGAELVTANRVLANEGIIEGFGHVSVRIPGTDELLIARSVSPGLVDAADIVRMDFDGNLLDDRDVRTYKETAIHRAIYRTRDDVGAVVHHHAPAVMPFTVTDVELRPVFHLAALFHRGVPTFDDYDPEYGRLVVTEAEGDRMADSLGECQAQLLAGHGANVVGADLREAVCATVYFVMNAQYQHAALQLGDPDYYEAPAEDPERMTREVIRSDLVVDRMWTYLTERLPDSLAG
jgi:HCOMODA/2-hydroxy-3-carboxy-muconic semialdehyde decarboxylase